MLTKKRGRYRVPEARNQTFRLPVTMIEAIAEDAEFQGCTKTHVVLDAVRFLLAAKALNYLATDAGWADFLARGMDPVKERAECTRVLVEIVGGEMPTPEPEAA